MRCILLLVLVIVLSAKSHGQKSQPNTVRLPVRAFTADDGLGGATITSLLKDTRGFLWIGTPDELLVYDGIRFQPFRYTDYAGASQSFRRPYLFSLGANGVFIAHEEGNHQFLLPAGRLREVSTPFNDFGYRSSMRVEGGARHIYRFSTTTRTAVYDAVRAQWSDVRAHSIPHVLATSLDSAGRTLLGCDTGVSARVINLHDRGSVSRSQAIELPFRARCLLQLSAGTLFAEAEGERSLWWMPKGGKFQNIARLQTAAYDICAAYAAGGTIYVAAGHSLLRFQPASGSVSEIVSETGEPLVRSGIFTQLLSDGRTLWVGSNTSGLIRVSLDGPRLRQLRSDTAVLNWSHAIHADLLRGRVYVGGYSGTVSVFDTAGQFVENLTPMLRRAGGAVSAYINAIDRLPDGRIFILSGHNWWVYDPSTRAVINLVGSVDSAKRARGIDPRAYMGRYGVLRTGPLEWWMSEKMGAIRWRLVPAQGSQPMRMEIVQVVSIPSPAPEAFASHDRAWWCASAGKLYRFDGHGILDSFRYPITAFATCITPDREGRLWIGTESGIVVWRSGKVERIITTESGLPNNHVYALLTDNSGWMWGSTNGGLFAVRLNDYSVRAFTAGDGLQGAEFNLGAQARDDRGRLYFGGMNGVNIVDPAVALWEEVSSPVTITRVAGVDTVYHAYPGSTSVPSLRLAHDRASLQISFTSPQLEASGPLRFEYRLRPSDSLWTDNGTRRELQLFLAPGDYRVEVRRKGEPDTAAAFSVSVTPPFYSTWWFFAALALVGGVVVATAVVRGNRRRYQQKLATLETARRIQEEKERISRELHDELGARAALLSHNAALLKEVEDGSQKTTALTARIMEATGDMLTALRETVWTLKQEAITAESLWLRYKNFIAKLGATYDHVHFVVEEDEALPTQPMDYARALHLLRILQEATMNAVKHSGAATITASARIADGKLVFCVADDGRGFDVESSGDEDEGNGLHNMRYRSKEAGLELSIRSGVGQGTTVEARI